VWLNNPRENWIVDRIRKEWHTHNPDTITHDIVSCDVIWIVAHWQWAMIPQKYLKSKKVVCTIHHIVPNKFNQKKLNDFIIRDQFVDVYHVPNKHTANFISQITNRPIHIISYWYNSNIWNLKHLSKQEAKEKLEIPEDKFVIGSFQRDTEGSDLISPKLEKGPDLFCDYIEKIYDQNILILLGGWRRQYIISRLNKANIPYKYIEFAPIEQLIDMYAACDLYIVSSRYEGGPQAIFEASAMKVPIISTRVGVAEEILCENCILDLKNQIYVPTKEDVNKNYQNVQKYDIINHKLNYLKMFEEVLNNDT